MQFLDTLSEECEIPRTFCAVKALNRSSKTENQGNGSISKFWVQTEENASLNLNIWNINDDIKKDETPVVATPVKKKRQNSSDLLEDGKDSLNFKTCDLN